MKKLLLIFFLILISQICHAGYRIYSGGNLSILNTNNSFPRFGGVFGIDVLLGSQEINFSFGANYLVRSSYLKDKTMTFVMSDQGYHFDVLFSVSYIEVPLLLNIGNNLTRKLSLELQLGPSLAIAISDNSKSYNSRHINFENNPEFRKQNKIDYSESFDPGHFWLQSNSGFYLKFGLFVYYQEYYLGIRYNHSLNELGHLNHLVLNGEKYKTIEFVFGIQVE